MNFQGGVICMKKKILNSEYELDKRVLNEFKMLYTNIINNKKVKKFCFTSISPKAGKTFVASNLAKIVAKQGKKILIICCNWDNCKGTEFLKLDNSRRSVMDLMDNDVSINDIIYKTDIDNLSIALGGDFINDIASFVLTRRLFEGLSTIENEYDYIFVDTASIYESNDTVNIASKCEGTILVMEPDVLPYKTALKYKKSMEHNHCNIMGVVINKRISS